MSTEPKSALATLFLGAGASSAFGFPATKEFLQKLAISLDDSKEKQLLLAFQQTQGISDIEHILEILDQVEQLESPLVKYLDYIKPNMPVAPTYAAKPSVNWKDFKSIATSLRKKIRNELFNQYEFDPDRRTEIKRRLEETLEAIWADKCDLVHLFTTNYDSVVEEGLSGSRYVCRDGFTDLRPSQPAIWRPTILDAPIFRLLPEQRFVNIYKLHGSLRWRLDKQGAQIVRVETEEKTGERSRRFGENVLLYPASKLPPISEPFGTLYSYFVKKLFSTHGCIVIGFSFRDPYINTVFVDYLRSSKQNLICIISPSAEEAMKNLLGSLTDGPLAEQVITLNNKFGDPYVTSLISTRIMSRVRS
jgi:hypothetical protein